MASTKQKSLNRAAPGVGNSKLGDVLADLIAKHNALLAKLDLDAGVTDTNYTTLCKVTDLESR